jgi:hypothetical protein
MARKLATTTVVTNPNTGAPTVIEAGADVPDWAEDLIEDHLFESEADPRQVAEDADVDDNAKPALAMAEEAGVTPVGVYPTSREPGDERNFATAPGPETVSAPVEDTEPGEPRGDEGPAEQAAAGGDPAEEPKKTAARRKRAADKGENQSE